MTEIKVINFRGKKYYKANSIISLLGYEGKINTANFVINNVPKEHREQFSQRQVWYVDCVGAAILLLKGKNKGSIQLRHHVNKILGDLIELKLNSIDINGVIEIDSEFSFLDTPVMV